MVHLRRSRRVIGVVPSNRELIESDALNLDTLEWSAKKWTKARVKLKSRAIL